MPPHPLLRALLRALCFVGLTESIFFRLIPAPATGSTGAASSLLGRLHASAWQAGTLAFFLSYGLMIAVLLAMSRLAVRTRVWPAGLNGFLATCLMSVALLGIAAPLSNAGPAFAAVFTWLAVVTILFIGMHAYTHSTGVVRAFLVCYAASIVCSAILTTGTFAARLSGPSRASTGLLAAAEESGLILCALSGALALLAFADPAAAFSRRPFEAWAATAFASSGALGFAALCYLAPPRLSPLGPDPEAVQVIVIAYGLFAALLGAGLNFAAPANRLRGYGILLLAMAGFPQRIALQEMLVVGGAVLLLAPARPDPAARILAAIFGPPGHRPSPPVGREQGEPGVGKI